MLFADLVGFTTLSEHLDPEQVKRIVDSCFEHLVGVVAEFGGRVDKLMGDGMLALFGAPIAHEDDPERAVRAALRMHEVLAANSTGLPGGADAEIRMRVGINTGEVLVGTLAGTDYTAMGDVVNTAARLQVAAPPGGVLVGSSTYSLTSHTFHYESAGELQAKGREQAVTAWLAVQPTAPPGVRRRRQDVPLTGRDTELALAEAALGVMSSTHRSVLVHLVGENGVGKSRLVDEVVQRMRDREETTVLEGACVPYGETNVWFPIATALTRHLDLDPGAPLDVVRAAAEARATDMLATLPAAERDRIVDVFAHLLGYPSPIDRLDPAIARSTVHHAVSTVLEHRAARGPIILCVDDLHWADQDVLDLLGHLVESLSRHRFALVTTTRPGAEIEWPPTSERCTVVSLTLQPLSRFDTERLARQLLSDSTAADDSMIAALFDRSGGNPLFLIELVALTDADGAARDLPDSLRTLIAARLDQLTLEQRQMLENAAVLGTSGRMVGLERFAAGLGQQYRFETVQELDDLGLLEVVGGRWEFRSDSVRDAAYQTLTKAARAVRHAAVAAALADTPGAADDRAHHVAAAAELVQELGPVEGVAPDIDVTAVAMLTAAAERALETGSLRMAIRTASRALDLIDPARRDDRTVARLLTMRASASVERRDIAAATDDLDRMQRIASRLGDALLDAEAHRLRGMLANNEGRVAEAREELGIAIDLLRRAERPELLARTLRVRGFIEMFGGSLVDAEWFFGEADGIFRQLGDERGRAYIEQHRAWIAFLSGEFTAARERLTHAASTLGQLGDRNGVGWAYGLLAFVEFFERQFDRAESLAHAVRREADARGDGWAVGMMDTLLAQLELWRGDIAQAHELAEKARARFKRINDSYGVAQALVPLLRAQIALGRATAVQRTTEELASLAGSRRNGPVPLQALAGAAMHRGNGAEVLEAVGRATDEMRAVGSRSPEPTILSAVAHLQLGDLDAALVALDSIDRPEGGTPFGDAAAALVFAAAGRADRALELADAVDTTTGATYLDDVFASVARAAASHSLADHDTAVGAAEQAALRASGAGDVVATALATEVYRAITGDVHPAHDSRHPLAEGWRTAVRLLVRER